MNHEKKNHPLSSIHYYLGSHRIELGGVGEALWEI